MDHDFYWGFSHFWWLIFPLFWMVAVMARLWSRHTRANRALDIIKSYADQGKEPPPELLKNLQGGTDGYCGWGGGWRHSTERRLHRAFVFTALAIAFGGLTFWNYYAGTPSHPHRLVIPIPLFAPLAF